MPLDLIAFAAAVEVRERSATTVTARFRDQAAFAGVQPTNVYYRVDDESGCTLVDWTAVAPPVAPADSVAIAITAEQNRVLNEVRATERRTVTVMANRGLAAQFVGSYDYRVRNLSWTS